MIGAISDALIRRMPDRISETAPGRTPIAVANPPLVLPGFSSPRSINLMSSIVRPFRISEMIQFRLSEIKLDFNFGISEIDCRRRAALTRARTTKMELSNWAPEHSDALRELIAKGLSFSEA